MKLLFHAVFALVALCVSGQTILIKQANVESSGWILNVTVANEDTNGGFNFGFLTNNSGPGNISLTLTSNGFDDTGTATTFQRTIYATKQLRLVFPNQTLNDVTATGDVPVVFQTNVIIRMALSDYVYSSDSSITMTASANWYSNNVPSTNAMSVVNNSTAAYPKCIANWSYPGWQRITNNTMTLRAVGYHRSGQNGRPLRVMQFVARDSHSNAVTNRVTTMTIDSTLSTFDSVPVCEYVGSLNISSFTNGDSIRCDFEAYPWQGDSGSVLDTMDNLYKQPTPMYASITNLCDRLNTYSSSIAVVDPGGSDVNGRASTNSDPTQINSAQYFASIAKAANQIAASNNAAFNHNDCGGGIIYLRTGSYTFAGASSSYGTATPTNWVTIQPYPGVTRANAIIGNNSGDQLLGNSKIHLYNLTLTNNSALEFLGVPYLWIDSMVLNHQKGTTFDGTQYEYWTDNVITNIVGGISYIAGQVKVPVLVRGNSITNSGLNGGAGIGIFSYTVLGNLIDFKGVSAGNFGNQLFATDPATAATLPVPSSTNSIIAYNRVINLPIALPVFNLGVASNNVNGAAIIQNIVEKTSTSGTQPLIQIAGNGANDVVTNFSNVLIWYLTAEGERWNAAYDASGTSNHTRAFWSVKKSVTASDYNIKSDTYSGFDTASGNRIGNWPALFGVGWDGNAMSANTNFTSAGSFLNAFSGLNTTMTNAESISGLTPIPGQPKLYWRYNTMGAYDGATVGSGNGDYHLLSDSPAVVNPLGSWYGLPFDIEGNNRGGFDPPGAYASASPRKGGAFFAQ